MVCLPKDGYWYLRMNRSQGIKKGRICKTRNIIVIVIPDWPPAPRNFKIWSLIGCIIRIGAIKTQAFHNPISKVGIIDFINPQNILRYFLFLYKIMAKYLSLISINYIFNQTFKLKILFRALLNL